jgi:hypothetical protein
MEDNESVFNSYLNRLFVDPNDLLRPWNLDKIEKDYNIWRVPVRWLKIYVLANNCESFATHTHIGCVQNVIRRVDQHNGLITGGPSETKRAEGHWKLMFYMILPPYRNYSSKDIKKICKSGRGWASRCTKTLELAMTRDLEFRISKDIFDENSKYYTESIVKTLNEYMDDSNIENLDRLFIEGQNTTILNKVTTTTTMDNNGTTVTQPSRKRGRKPKQQQDKTTTATQETKRRGRKRKADSDVVVVLDN